MIIVRTSKPNKESNQWELIGILEGKAHFRLLSGYAGGYNNYSTKIRRHYGKTYINGSFTFGNSGEKIFIAEYIKEFIENLNVD